MLRLERTTLHVPVEIMFIDKFQKLFGLGQHGVSDCKFPLCLGNMNPGSADSLAHLVSGRDRISILGDLLNRLSHRAYPPLVRHPSLCLLDHSLASHARIVVGESDECGGCPAICDRFADEEGEQPFEFGVGGCYPWGGHHMCKEDCDQQGNTLGGVGVGSFENRCNKPGETLRIGHGGRAVSSTVNDVFQRLASRAGF
ncbi:hypothetical protein BD309DRAFT_964115 [Dichomitus squalens]|nr:hypothetical protein BD309DRAFT_964115 [Dichomitus squalens]